jgi:hypothetical protein
VAPSPSSQPPVASKSRSPAELGLRPRKKSTLAERARGVRRSERSCPDRLRRDMLAFMGSGNLCRDCSDGDKSEVRVRRYRLTAPVALVSGLGGQSPTISANPACSRSAARSSSARAASARDGESSTARRRWASAASVRPARLSKQAVL